MLDPQSVSLRQATGDDSELIFIIKKVAFRTYVEQTWGWDEKAQREKHRENFVPSSIQIISYKGIDAGWIGVERTELAIRVVNIHIIPEYQNLGIGALLLQRILAEATERRLPVVLRVLKDNPRAKALYERLGFSVTSVTKTHFLMEACP